MGKAMNKSDLDLIRSTFHYNPKTGNIRKSPEKNDCVRWYRSQAGKTYGKVSCGGKSLYAHRVAMFLVTGKWPSGQVDHKDGNGKNNKLSNLRVVSASENQRNLRCYQNSLSGLSGVSWLPTQQKWIARIQKNKVQYYFGLHETLLDAAASRISGANGMGFYHCHGRQRPL